jgi:hypothetical protein
MKDNKILDRVVIVMGRLCAIGFCLFVWGVVYALVFE